MKKKSVFQLFLKLLIIIVVIPVIVVYCALFYYMTNALVNKTKENLSLLIDITEQTLTESLDTVIESTLTIIANTYCRSFLTSSRDDYVDYLRMYSEAQNELISCQLENKYILYIQLESLDGDNRVSSSGIYQYSITDEERTLMLESNGMWHFRREENGVLSVCRLMNDIYAPEESLGYIKIILDSSALNNIMSNAVDQGEYSYTLIYTPESMEIISTDSSLAGYVGEMTEAISSAAGEEYFLLPEMNLLYTYSHLTIHTRSCLLIAATANPGSRYYPLFAGMTVLFGLLLIIFAIVYAWLYRRYIAAPLQQLNDSMQYYVETSRDPLDQPAPTLYGEIRELYASFLSMTETIRRSYDKTYGLQVKLRDANLLILQSEMNPHFLYNVLDSIHWAIELGETETAEEMLQKLAAMFRGATLNSQRSIIPLEDELRNVDNYLSLEKDRFGDRLHIDRYEDPDTGSPQVIKFILQPLVENAIRHGYRNSQADRWNISIRIFPRKDASRTDADESMTDLIYEVEDDGVGANETYIASILHGSIRKDGSLEGFALENIQSRIQLRYGVRYGITYRRRPKGGSVFTVCQPLLYDLPPETD